MVSEVKGLASYGDSRSCSINLGKYCSNGLRLTPSIWIAEVAPQTEEGCCPPAPTGADPAGLSGRNVIADWPVPYSALPPDPRRNYSQTSRPLHMYVLHQSPSSFVNPFWPRLLSSIVIFKAGFIFLSHLPRLLLSLHAGPTFNPLTFISRLIPFTRPWNSLPCYTAIPYRARASSRVWLGFVYSFWYSQDDDSCEATFSGPRCERILGRRPDRP